MSQLLKVNNLRVQYGVDHVVLNDIAITVGPKEIVSLVGESGSGKTTLIRTIGGMLPETAQINSGTIVFAGKDLRNMTDVQWRHVHGKEISMIFQNPAAYFNPIKKVGKQLVDTIRIHEHISKKEAQKKVYEALSKMNFDNPERIMTAYPFQLSGGMIQRVAIALSYVLEPKLILADEATSALDVISQKQIIDELMALRDRINTSIILVTHNIGAAAYMSDRIYVMKDGRMVEYNQCCQVAQEPKEAYTKELFQAVPRLKGHHGPGHRCRKHKKSCTRCSL
jgi:ABC-type dipeptide/oligopeptide/nickel transport system ATPase component